MASEAIVAAVLIATGTLCQRNDDGALSTWEVEKCADNMLKWAERNLDKPTSKDAIGRNRPPYGSPGGDL